MSECGIRVWISTPSFPSSIYRAFTMSRHKWDAYSRQFLFNTATKYGFRWELYLSVRNKHMHLNGSFPVYLYAFFRFSYEVKSCKYTNETESTIKSTHLLFPSVLVKSYFVLSTNSWTDNIFGAYETLLVVSSSTAECRRWWDLVPVSISITRSAALQKTEK